MKLIKCEKGHYFDNDKFENCPHCEGIEFETEEGSSATQVTEMLEDTIPYAVNQAPLVGESGKAAFEQGLEDLEKSFDEEEDGFEYESDAELSSEAAEEAVEEAESASEATEEAVEETEASEEAVDNEQTDYETEPVTGTSSIWEIMEESIEDDETETAEQEDASTAASVPEALAKEAESEPAKQESTENFVAESAAETAITEQTGMDESTSESVSDAVTEQTDNTANAEDAATVEDMNGKSAEEIVNEMANDLDEERVYHNTNPVAGLLVALDGPNKGDAYVVREGRNFIGCSDKMDIRVPHNEKICTDKYAIVIYDKRSDKFFFQPGESRDLFYLNDDLLIATAEFKNDDIIYMANVQFLFIELKHPKISWR